MAPNNYISANPALFQKQGIARSKNHQKPLFKLKNFNAGLDLEGFEVKKWFSNRHTPRNTKKCNVRSKIR